MVKNGSLLNHFLSKLNILRLKIGFKATLCILEIVTENSKFDIENFIPVLRERMFTKERYVSHCNYSNKVNISMP